MGYRLSPRAQRDIEDIADHLAEENPAAAKRLIERMRRQWELLATQPRSGSLREDIGNKIRRIVVGQYLCFYIIVEENVEILRVLHGHRDVTAEDIGGGETES